MPARSGTLEVDLSSPEAALIRHALANDLRVKTLAMLCEKVMNINEIATALGVSQPAVSTYVKVLQDAGLVECETISTDRGSEKRCWALFERIVFESKLAGPAQNEFLESVSMPVGMFTDVSLEGALCGMASAEKVLTENDPTEILRAERAEAQLLWMSKGWVEYSFPCPIPAEAEITSVIFTAEMCSEAYNYNEDWPSDITVWINGAEVGTWVCPGDYGASRGRLNPPWWGHLWTQHGLLKSWAVHNFGSLLDETPIAPTELRGLQLSPGRTVRVRIGNKDNAEHVGGLNLFGKRFGNYPQDLVLSFSYKLVRP